MVRDRQDVIKVRLSGPNLNYANSCSIYREVWILPACLLLLIYV